MARFQGRRSDDASGLERGLSRLGGRRLERIVRAILEQRAMRVADAVERRDHFVGELPRLFDNGGG